MTAIEARKISDARPSESDIKSILEVCYQQIRDKAEMGFTNTTIRLEGYPVSTIGILQSRLKENGFCVFTPDWNLEVNW